MRRSIIGLLLLTATLLAGCSSSPGGGLPSEVQENGWNVRVTYPNGTTHTYHTTSDPEQEDTSGNGLNDFQEHQLGTDPRKLDTDHDGLLDGSTQCMEVGSDRYERFQSESILEDPDNPGCFLGEQPLEYRDLEEWLDPTSAFTSDSETIGNGLTDSEEILGWDVKLEGQEPYSTYSNPKLPDTSGNGLHDGLEKQLGTDPQLEDTDGDGINDQRDAAPLGNLVITLHIDEVTLKEDQSVVPGSGAELVVEVLVDGERIEIGPYTLQQGENRLDVEHEIDASDRASGLTDGAGAGSWDRDFTLSFWHNETENEEIEVRDASEKAHVLQFTFSAFDDVWEGHAESGTTSGADAEVTFDVTSSIKPVE